MKVPELSYFSRVQQKDVVLAEEMFHGYSEGNDLESKKQAFLEMMTTFTNSHHFERMFYRSYDETTLSIKHVVPK